MLVLGLDYSARRLSGAQIKAAGYQFVNRYLDFPGQGWPPLTAFEVADLLANDIEVHGIYEQTTSDPAGGYSAGVRMARQAVSSARAAKLPSGSTIFMCSDAWLSTHGISLGTAMYFLDGASSVIDLSGYVLGAYGFADFIFAAAEGGHADRFWLCGAEIPDEHRPNWLHMYQWNNGRVYVPHPNGLECDLNKKYLSMKGDDMFEQTDRNNLNDITKTPGEQERIIWLTEVDALWRKTAADVEALKASGVPVDLKLSDEDKADIARMVVDLLAKRVAD